MAILLQMQLYSSFALEKNAMIPEISDGKVLRNKTKLTKIFVVVKLENVAMITISNGSLMPSHFSTNSH